MKKGFFISLLFAAGIVVHSSFSDDEPKTPAELGRLLFSDVILSGNRTINCATCHKPEFAFADTVALSPGVNKRTGNRNTPSAMNLQMQRTFFWDGRAGSLEEQALMPIENHKEMDLPLDKAIARLKKSKKYNSYFRNVFNREPNREDLAKALADFERTLETSDSPFDNWKFSDDSTAVSENVRRGFVIFNTKGKCSQCHFGANFTRDEFRNIGLFNGKELNDSGRAAITGKNEDLGKFKIGPLRNIALTAPYMHDGRFKTLKEVIEFYDDPSKVVKDAINIDSLLSKPLQLTAGEKADLEAFLRALTDKQLVKSKIRN